MRLFNSNLMMGISAFSWEGDRIVVDLNRTCSRQNPGYPPGEERRPPACPHPSAAQFENRSTLNLGCCQVPELTPNLGIKLNSRVPLPDLPGEGPSREILPSVASKHRAPLPKAGSRDFAISLRSSGTNRF
jgi:hypothetical protein